MVVTCSNLLIHNFLDKLHIILAHMKKNIQILSLIIALSVIFGLISAGCSYVYNLDEHPENKITDPKKELCIETADMMKKHGYNIKIFDVKDFSGDCWNPFDYFYDDTDVISFSV